MKRHPRWKSIISLVLACSLLGLAAAGCAWTKKVTTDVTDWMDSRDSGIRKRVVVAGFATALPAQAARAAAMTKAISDSLEKDGGVVLVPEGDLNQAATRALGPTLDQRAAIIQGARELGVVSLVSGSLSDLSLTREMAGIYGFRDNTPFMRMELALSVVGVAGGVLLSEKSFRVQKEIDPVLAANINQGKEPPEDLVNSMAAELVEEASDWVESIVIAQAWAGFVMEAEPGRVKITVGRDTAIPKGEDLVLYSMGQAIKTGSGRTINLPGQPIGRLRLTELGARESWAEPLPLEEGKPLPEVQPGMVVRTR